MKTPPKRPRGRPPGKIQNAPTSLVLPVAMLDAVRSHAASRHESTGEWYRRAILAQLALEDVREARDRERGE